MKEQRWASLHGHSTYSYGDGLGQPVEHVGVAADLGIPAIAMSEHGNVSSHVKLEQAALAAGIQPVFGCELYTGGVGDSASRFKWHLTTLAMNAVGFQNLNSLVSQGWAEGFYYEPTVSGEMLAAASEGLIVLSGCAGSKMAVDLLGGKGQPAHSPDYAAARETALRFRDLMGDRFYLEIQPFPELERTRLINQAWQRLSEETGIPVVVTGDVHYPKPADNEMQVLLHAIDRGGKNNTVEKQAQGWSYDVRLTMFRDKMLVKKLRATGLTEAQAWRAIDISGEIAGRCKVTLPKLQELTWPSVEPSVEVFRKLLNAGWKYRGVSALPAAERERYKERMKMECALIEKKGFVDYFLVIADLVTWAKDSGIAVGPGRGSSAGSLVVWLLRINEVNPMLFRNLLFERFIDEERHDLPDIDLDFDDDERWRIRARLVELYGADRVGNIGTFTNYKGKNSLDDVGRVSRVPPFATEGIKEMLIERMSGDLRGNATIEDTIGMFPKVREIFEQYPVLYKAQRLEGNLKGFSVHASGLVVANEPLTHSCAVYERRDKAGEVVGNVLSIDKHDAEHINALKIDALGLTTMGLIGRCLKMIGMTLPQLYSISLSDPMTLAGFQRNEVVGIFQFDGRAMRSVNREVKPDTFAEVCDINALARPGPLHSGAAAEYIMVKHGKKKALNLHPTVTRVTAESNGQIVYQEQILQIVRLLGNFSWEEAALIRKLISKKQGEQAFSRSMNKFLDGAMANGMTEAKALLVWKQLVTSGSYAFGAAHCSSGDTILSRPWVSSPLTLEFLYRAVHLYKNRKGGKGITPFAGPCISCGLAEAKHWAAEQCFSCYCLRRNFNAGNFSVLSYGSDGRVKPNLVRSVMMNGVQQLWRITMKSGASVRVTGDHRFLGRDGWIETDDILPGAWLRMSVGESTKAAWTPRWGYNYAQLKKAKVKRCSKCGTDVNVDVSHRDQDEQNDAPSNLWYLCRSHHVQYDGASLPWSSGYETKLDQVVSIEKDAEEPVYTLEMSPEVGHNYVTGEGFINHNCAAYGMLAWYCMFLKQHHPLEFYCSALQKFSAPSHKEKSLDILKEATKKGIPILPPDPVISGLNWEVDYSVGGLRAGFTQVHGIGDSIAGAMENYRDNWQVTSWADYANVRGIGPVTMEKVSSFAALEDPFGMHLMTDTLDAMRRWIFDKGIDELDLPMPRSKSEDVPYEDIKGTHVWLGTVRNRNLKDIYELHRSRTGEELDPGSVREPQYVNYLAMDCEDDTGPLSLTVHRYGGLYDRYKDALWDMDPKRDLLLVRGYKRKEFRRALYVTELWILNPEKLL